MQFPSFLATATILAFGSTAVPTKWDSDRSIVIRDFTAPSYQAASDLQNVSTYHPLTRGKGSIGYLYKNAWRKGQFGELGLSPTTSYDHVNY